MTGPEAALGIVVFGGLFWILRPLVGALAKRVAGETRRAPTPDQLGALREELLEELQHVRQDLAELADRMDFTERLLAKQRDAERLAPPRT